MRHSGRTAWLIAGILLAAAAAAGIPAPARGFTLPACHDDTSVARANTHGSPLNGTFGQPGQPANHSHGYYYLDISTAGCPVGADGYVHLLGRVTANGIGLLPGHPACDTTAWTGPCDPSWRAVTGDALAAEDPAWGFEIKDAATGTVLACTGGNGSGGSDCPGTPNAAVPGGTTAEFRYDYALPGRGYRFRIANEYADNGVTDVMWETATFDVVACGTCEP